MDKVPFTSHQIMAYFLPGFIFHVLFKYMWLEWDYITIYQFMASNGEHTGLIILFFVCAYATGIVLDTFRTSIVESIANTLPFKRFIRAKADGNLSAFWQEMLISYIRKLNNFLNSGMLKPAAWNQRGVPEK